MSLLDSDLPDEGTNNHDWKRLTLTRARTLQRKRSGTGSIASAMLQLLEAERTKVPSEESVGNYRQCRTSGESVGREVSEGAAK